MSRDEKLKIRRIEVKRKRKGLRRKEKMEKKAHREINPYWKYYTCNQKEVYKKLKAKESPKSVVGAGWGFLDHFFIFLFSLGFLSNVDFTPRKVQRVMVPIILLILTYEVKQLMGINSMNRLEDNLFRDIALLKIIGFTARQIEGGFCNRGKGKRKPPIHRDTLSDFLSKLSPKEANFILREAVKSLVKRGFIKGGKFILDATELPTTKKFKGCGVKKEIERKMDKDGMEVFVAKYIYGFKLLVVMEAKRRIVVAAKVVKINEHESQFTFGMIREAERNISEGGKIGTLLIDRGFIDGVVLWKLKKEGIHFIIPVRGNMDIAKDIRGFRSEKADGDKIFYEETKDVKAIGVKWLLSYDQFGNEGHGKRKNRKDFKANPINAVMVIYWNGEEIEEGKEKVFITDLPVSKPLKIIDDYDLRSIIENQCFRELKQGYYLLSFPQKTKNAVTSHCILTLIIFSFINAYKTKQGQELAEKGVRRWREKQMGDSIHKMIVYYDGIYGIVDVEELFYIMGMTPKELFRLKPERFKTDMG